MKKKQNRATNANEGEGSRTAARAYDAKATSAARDEAHVEKAALEAKEALEGEEGPELKEADRRGKKHQHK